MKVLNMGAPQPDTATIKLMLERLTCRWHEIGADQWLSLEIRMIARGSSPVPLKYRPDIDGIQMAVDDIVHWNAKGRNAYVCVNPLKENVGGSASDTDIAAAFYCFADCDDQAAGDALKAFVGPKYSHVVLTGTKPFPRPHPYWELTEPQADLDAWSEMQRRIAAALGSDRVVVNPSRIMRIAGTVTWPDQAKQERGYVSEIATFHDKASGPVEWGSLDRAFAQAAPQAALPTLASIDTGPKPLDRQEAATAAMSGADWHNNMIRLVASYVSKGLSDGEIHAITDAMTLAGYTVEETRNEVQTAINGARAKGFTPEVSAPPPVKTEPAPPPENEFNKLSTESSGSPAPLEFPATAWQPIDLSEIPRTQFVYSDFYARGYTSLTIAPPKVGKSMLALAEAIDMATGKGILTGVEREPLKVLYFNAEDDQHTLNNRVAALLTHYGFDQSEIEGRLYVVSGVEWENFFLTYGELGAINEPVFQMLQRFIEREGIDVAKFDPLQDMSDAPETNDVFRRLGRRLRKMSVETNAAVGLVHHTRKTQPGAELTIDDARGGSALRGTARFNRILAPMTEQEAAKAGLANHRWFMRIGDMESNLAPPSADVNRWFEKMSIECPNGERVGAIQPWKWPDAFDGVTSESANMVRGIIDRRETPPRANQQATDWVGNIVCDVLGLNPADKASRARAAQIVKTWITTDVLRAYAEHDGRTGREIEYVVCGANNPGTSQ